MSEAGVPDTGRPQRAFGRWLARLPALRLLRARIKMLPEDADGPDVIEAARPLIEDNAWIRTIVATAARRVARDPWFQPPLRPLDHGRQAGLVLFDDGRLRISVRRVPLERIATHKVGGSAGRSIAFTGAHTLQHVVRSGRAVLDLWTAEPAGPGFSAKTAPPCRRAGQMTLADGMVFALDGRREAWSIAAQSGDLVLVEASVPCTHVPLAIEYDAGTGAFRAASATHGAVARLQLMATLARQLGRQDAAAPIAAIVADPHAPFFLRWHLARELLALDRAAALPLLRGMAAGDLHPELRGAAERTLALLAA